ncbi:MAG TPA: hypothetical protein VK308_05030 [Pyrinomonadaceae bacterium]|nr:hypothetical protein [Pyrinomonadaceae bacterium]
MKKLFFINCIVLMFGVSLFGQTTKADLEQLRKEINLPSSVSISTADVSFPASKPTKIYLAIKHNKKLAKNFNDWVEQWNKTKAAQFGEVQIVDNLNDADIAAVQYQFGVGRVVREDSVRLKTGNDPRKKQKDGINEDDRLVLGGIGNSKARAEVAAKTLTRPLYSYLIVRGQNSSWFVDYSRIDDQISDENFPEKLLQSTIESRLKNR